jgi:NADH-quinone oxidoreductase subunit L
VALGVGGYGIAIFHLFTHAFFKALLFLGAGSVIHAMGGEQDMRKMGGLAPHIRITWAMMLIGTLALTGFPLTAGYFSKDAVIEAAYASEAAPHLFAYVLLIIAAFCTSFYSWRLAFMTFNGPTRADKETIEHSHESPMVMLVPLFVLGLGALFAGWYFAPYFIGHEEALFWGSAIYRGEHNHILHDMHNEEIVTEWVKYSPFVAMVLGFVLAYLFYIRNTKLPQKLAAMHQPVYQFLLNKWYIDELYDFLFVKPAFWLGRLFWKQGDGAVIDGLGPNGIAARVAQGSGLITRLQTGYVYHYAFAMLIGVAAIVSWFSFGGTH